MDIAAMNVRVTLQKKSRHLSVVVPIVKMVPQLHREHRLLPFPGNPRRML